MGRELLEDSSSRWRFRVSLDARGSGEQSAGRSGSAHSAVGCDEGAGGLECLCISERAHKILVGTISFALEIKRNISASVSCFGFVEYIEAEANASAGQRDRATGNNGRDEGAVTEALVNLSSLGGTTRRRIVVLQTHLHQGAATSLYISAQRR